MASHLAIELPRRKFSVAEFEQMGRAGVLGEDDRVELLAGEVVMMAPIGPPHAGIVDILARWFITSLGERAVVRVQNPIRLTPLSEPQPDLVLVKPRRGGYLTSHPGPDDILLVVEVSGSSLRVAREVKIPIYAAAGILEVWVVDIEAGEVHTHRAPRASAYLDIRTSRRGAHVLPGAFADLRLAVTEIFGG